MVSSSCLLRKGSPTVLGVVSDMLIFLCTKCTRTYHQGSKVVSYERWGTWNRVLFELLFGFSVHVMYADQTTQNCRGLRPWPVRPWNINIIPFACVFHSFRIKNQHRTLIALWSVIWNLMLDEQLMSYIKSPINLHIQTAPLYCTHSWQLTAGLCIYCSTVSI